MIRFIIRHPKIYTSPKDLATDLGVKLRKARPGKEGNYARDFFMHYPDPNVVRMGGPRYDFIWSFYVASKGLQRLSLARDGIPTPGTRLAFEPLRGDKFVVRPLRHQGGAHFRVTNDPADFRPGHEYISELFPKTHEYRIVYVYGHPAVVLRKRAAEGVKLKPDEPWNHAAGQAVFQTIEDVARSNLAVHTDCFVRLLDSHVVRDSHYCGVDILYNHKSREWVVCEINSCPALQIPENRAKVAQLIKEHRA